MLSTSAASSLLLSMLSAKIKLSIIMCSASLFYTGYCLSLFLYLIFSVISCSHLARSYTFLRYSLFISYLVTL